MLECYFFYTRHNIPKLGARETAKCVVRNCAVFWDFAGIPMVKECHAITKMEKLVLQYKTILKYGSQKETNETYRLNVRTFEIMLENFFDISNQKKVNDMRNEVARTLLISHQRGGRSSCLDKIMDTREFAVPAVQKEQEEGEKTKLSKQGRPQLTISQYFRNSNREKRVKWSLKNNLIF